MFRLVFTKFLYFMIFNISHGISKTYISMIFVIFSRAVVNSIAL